MLFESGLKHTNKQQKDKNSLTYKESKLKLQIQRFDALTLCCRALYEYVA